MSYAVLERGKSGIIGKICVRVGVGCMPGEEAIEVPCLVYSITVVLGGGKGMGG